MSDDYFDGRNGRGPGANVDWVEYQRGRNDAERARQNAVASSPPARSPSPWGDGGGGGGGGGNAGAGLGILFVAGAALVAIGVGIALAITLLLPALIAALLVFAAARLRPGRQAPTYGEAYGAALLGLMVYVLITAGVGFVLVALLDGPRQPGLLFELARIAMAALQVGLVSLESADVAGRVLEQLGAAAEDPRWRPGMLAGALAMLYGPGLLACALVLRWRLDATFGGWLGFVAACGVSLAAVVASIFSSAWGFVFLVRHAEVLRFATDAAVLNAAFVAGLVLLAHVVVGGALAALLLYAVLRPRFGAAATGAPPAPHVLAGYGSGCFVMLAYGLLLTGGFWLFREGDALLAALRGGDGPATLAALPGPALRDFLLLQTPALALGVAMMVSQPSRHEAGAARRAVVALVFAIGLPLAALLTLSIAVPRSGDQFAVRRQPLLQALGLQPLIDGLRPAPAAASAFDGEWYSAQRRYGLRIAGVRGFVTVPGGGALQAGHIVLSIEAVAGRGFRGQHLAPDGRWQAVNGELVDAQTLRLRGATTSWTLSRR